jgi:hypothetical protein
VRKQPETFFFGLGHAQIAFIAIDHKSDMRIACEEQYGALVFFQALPEIVRIRFGQTTAFARRPLRERWQFFATARENIAIAFL